MFARVENSPRLKAVLKALQEHPHGLTGLDLCMHARIMNPGEVCSELRRQGYDIICREEPKSTAGRRVFRYRLIAEPVQEQGRING